MPILDSHRDQNSRDMHAVKSGDLLQLVSQNSFEGQEHVDIAAVFMTDVDQTVNCF